LLPERDLPLRIVGEEAFFDFLGPQDEPWLRVLLDEMARFEGRRWRELAERLAEPLPCLAPHFKRRCATRVLARLWRREQVAAAPPRQIRARLFEAAGASGAPREEILAATASSFGISPQDLARSVFADLPGERRMHAPNPIPSAAEAALRTNLAVAQAVIMRSARLELRLQGAVRPIVRLAKLQGLLCHVRENRAPDAGGAPGSGDSASIGGCHEPVLEISGPFSLFRHTLLYGRALAALLPHLAWCSRFELRASAALRGRIVDITLGSNAPILPAPPPKTFDSRLEERFAHDFERAAPDWHLFREPEPLRAGSTIIFPDFLLQHRIHQHRRILLEIVGFWTPEYLARKIARLCEAGIPRIILCIDEDRACEEARIPLGWPLVRFRRRLDAAAVLREVERISDDGQREFPPQDTERVEPVVKNATLRA
jgi:predicted nuclease of restriction endonuclease-like RecB superfamily